MASFNLKNAVLTIQDGTAVTPLSITVKIGDGNLTFSEKVNREYQLNRGNLDTVRNGDDIPVDVSFDFRWEYVKTESPTPASVRDVLARVNQASAWVSTDSDTCAPYAVDLVFVFTPTCTADKTETVTLSDFRYEDISYDAKAGTISCSGKCNVVSPTFTRTAQA